MLSLGAKETKGPLWRTNHELRPGKSLCPARFCWGPEVEARKELLQPRKGAEGTSLVWFPSRNFSDLDGSRRCHLPRTGTAVGGQSSPASTKATRSMPVEEIL